MSELSFIHRFIPSADAAGSRTLLLLHGTGGDENDLLPLGKELDPQANVLSPRGKVLERGMPRFFARFPDGSFDEADLRMRAAELAGFIGEAAAHYGFDASRVMAVGYSNGANISAGMLLLSPQTLAGAVLLRAALPFESEPVPALKDKPVLLLGGKHDEMIPPSSTQQLSEILRQSGAAVETVWLETGHRLTGEDKRLAKAFLTHAS